MTATGREIWNVFVKGTGFSNTTSFRVDFRARGGAESHTPPASGKIQGQNRGRCQEVLLWTSKILKGLQPKPVHAPSCLAGASVGKVGACEWREESTTARRKGEILEDDKVRGR